MRHVLDRGVAHTEFFCGNQKGIDHLKNLGIDEKYNFKIYPKEV